MIDSPRRLRTLLEEHEFLVAPTVYDPLSARLAEEAGFPLCYIGGYVVGSHLSCGEPLLTATEMVDVSARISDSIGIPTIADAGAGFGNLPHTLRTVQGFQRAGVAGIHIEDQVVPKRVGYHRGEVHVVSREEMTNKLRLALQVSRETGLVIIARTDARRAVNGGVAEALARLELFVELGADLLLAFPADAQEAAAMSRVAPGKLVYVAPEGRTTRPNLEVDQLRDLGYRMLVYSEGCLLRVSHTLREYYRQLRDLPVSRGEDEAFLAAQRTALESTLDLQAAHALEDLEPV